MSQPQHHHVRRVVLPSGKAIEVIYYEDIEPALEHVPSRAPLAGGRPEGAEMHLCGTCDSTLVHPLEWSESGPLHWKVTLRCPNCEWTGTGVFTQAEVELFDEELDRGTEQLVHDMQSLSVANLDDEVERFAAALAQDLILPEDF